MVYGSHVNTESDLREKLKLTSEGVLIVRSDGAPLTLLCQTLLYEILTQKKMPVHACASEHFDCSAVTLILICEDIRQLKPFLVDQMRLILRFEPYSQEEMHRIIAQRQKFLGWSLNDKALAQRISYARGYPGWAVRILSVGRWLARGEGKT